MKTHSSGCSSLLINNLPIYLSINKASAYNLHGEQGGSHPVTASFFKQVQVLALLSLLCTFKVGLPAHRQLEQMDVFRGVHYNVGSEVSRQGCWEDVQLPRQIGNSS